MKKILTLLILLTGCSDYSIKKEDNSEILIHPEFINFGHLISGQESAEDSFIIANAGNKNLYIQKPQINFDERLMLDETLLDEYTIQPGELIEFSVYYIPKSFEYVNTNIVITSNDEDESQYEITVEGYGDAPLLEVIPENMSLETNINCELSETITLKNSGNIDLNIQDITQITTMPQTFWLDYGSLSSFPWVLLPGQEIDIYIDYSPVSINSDYNSLKIQSNDPTKSMYEIFQNGQGIENSMLTDIYIQEDIKKVDILFVIDNSGSMAVFQTQLSDQMINFLNIFLSLDVNYHLAFITTDMYHFIDYNGYNWISNSYTNPVDWAMSIINSIGTRGSGNERGIEMAKFSMDYYNNNPNGFLREESTLAIIYVSDEFDYSMGRYYTYYPFFDGFKTNISLMRHFAVIGDYPNGCSTTYSGYPRYIEFGDGYYQMTDRYNGEWYSICAIDWGAQMVSLANSLAERKVFELTSQNVDESTIEVFVNGQNDSGWIYDSSINSIIFNDNNIPSVNQTITINYYLNECY